MRGSVRMSAKYVLLTGIAMLAPNLAYAQETPEPTASPADEAQDSGEIIVTAQRRGEALQKVPIAITAIQGDDLQRAGTKSTFDLLVNIPSVTVTTTGNTANIFIRGVGQTGTGPNNENSVATYIDDVYMASPSGNLSQFNNLKQVVVLKGPQGTLFGRNSTGGVIQLTTRDPGPELAIDASIGYANYDTINGSLYVGGGLAEGIAADISLLYENQRRGWGYNYTRQHDIQGKGDRFAVRAKLLVEPGPNTKISLSGDYSTQSNDGSNYQPTPGNPLRATLPPLGRYDTAGNTADLSSFRNGGISLKLEQDLGFARLVSISALRDSFAQLNLDQDMGPTTVVDAYVGLYSKYGTQELQLLSQSDSKLVWTVGAFYMKKKDAYRPLGVRSILPAFVSETFSTQHTDSLSVYGQATYPVFDNTNLTGGLRYTTETIKNVEQRVVRASGTTTFPDNQFTNNDWTWRVAIDHRFSPDIMAYVSYNRGLKSGGYNLGTLGAPPFFPEVLDAYEFGIKTQFANRTIQANLAMFYYDYSNIQVQSAITGSAVVTNAAQATIKGLDFDLTIRPIEGWTISANAAFLDGKYDVFRNAVVRSETGALLGGPGGLDVSGNQTIYTPKFSGTISSSYVIRSSIGNITLTGAVTYYGGAPLTPDGAIRQPKYTLVNGSIRWVSSSENFSVMLWGKNLTDAEYYRQRNTVAFGGYQTAAAPRTYGVTLGVNF